MKMNKKGYTLTEAMMTVAILGILGGSAAPIMVRVNNFWRQTTARNEIERDVRASLDQINRTLRQADRKTVNIDQVSGQPPFSRITFNVEDGSACNSTNPAISLSWSAVRPR